MRRTVDATAVFVLAASLTMFGCMEPAPTMVLDGDGTAFFNRAPAEGFDILRRRAPLSHDLTVTQLVGAAGGRLTIEDAGVTFVIPPNALGAETEITMTALSGDALAVEFAPHGLTFDVPAAMHVDIEPTHAPRGLLDLPDGTALRSVLGVYFEGDPRLGVEPRENIPTFMLDGSIVFRVGHFSGYATASG